MTFAALAAYRQFVIWRIEGGTKVPLHPFHGYKCDPHDPANWVSANEAAAYAAMHGANGIAFVFTAADPFWFLDIDHCYTPEAGWSDTARDLLARFAGAGVEVGYSGDGLHVFGTATTIPPHRKKIKLPDGKKLEFYSERRFVALTGTHATGDAGSDHTAAVAALVQQYFAGSDDTDAGDVQWIDAADPAWSGPDDDAELIRRMLGARESVNAVLGNSATFAQLWYGDAPALGAIYPDRYHTPPRPFDPSDADLALAGHLAFWTGKNTARMARLMRQSGLSRPKWTEHKTYLWLTIRKACGKCQRVYQQRSAAPASSAPGPAGPPAAPPAGTAPAAATGTGTSLPATGVAWMPVQDQPGYFSGCVYVRELHRIFVPDGGLLDAGQFKATYGGYLFAFDSQNNKTEKNAWTVFTESQAIKFPKAESTCFRPELPTGTVVTEEGLRLVNTYVPIETRRLAGDASLFTDHLHKLLPVQEDYEIYLAYLAALVQYPGKKFQWCPVMQGAEGNGKTVFTRIISHCIGHRYTHLPNASDLGGNGSKFTGWIRGRLFIGIEEITLAERADILDALKPMITNSRLELQNKGKDQVTGDNRANFLAYCNDKGSIAVGTDKRRYAIFYSAQQTADDLTRDGMDALYFKRLYDWLEADGFAICNDYLRNYAVPDALNPAVLCHRAPRTSSTDEMLTLSITGVEAAVLEAIAEGRPGMANGWMSSMALNKFLEETGADRKVPVNKRQQMLEKLGFIHHPGLHEGRVNNFIPLDGGKPRLYVKRGHIAAQLCGGGLIIESYLKAQGIGGGMPDLSQAARS